MWLQVWESTEHVLTWSPAGSMLAHTSHRRGPATRWARTAPAARCHTTAPTARKPEGIQFDSARTKRVRHCLRTRLSCSQRLGLEAYKWNNTEMETQISSRTLFREHKCFMTEDPQCFVWGLCFLRAQSFLTEAQERGTAAAFLSVVQRNATCRTASSKSASKFYLIFSLIRSQRICNRFRETPSHEIKSSPTSNRHVPQQPLSRFLMQD